MPDRLADVIAELVPTGVLRAGIGMRNALLVSGRTVLGEPDGVAPGLARALAGRLGVDLQLVPYAAPSDVAEAAGTGAWDICLIGGDPARADKIAFTPAYAEIEATYLVPAGSPIRAAADADRPGMRIASCAKTAYDLWLARNIRHATVLRFAAMGDARRALEDNQVDALAGIRAFLAVEAARVPGSQTVAAPFFKIQQCIGTAREHAHGVHFLKSWVEQAKASGLVEDLIRLHRAYGLSMAAPA